MTSAAATFIGEGATMAAESAVLGTPAVYVSTLKLGYLQHIESAYGLVRAYDGPNRQQRALDGALGMLREDPAVWKHRRDRLLEDTVDTTAVIVEQLLSCASSD